MPVNTMKVDKTKDFMPKPGMNKAEIKKKRTPFSKTYLNPDGTFSTEVYSETVNFKNKSGNMQTIDNTLVTKVKDGYEYENLANSVNVSFAKNNMDGRLVRYAIDETHWIEFSPTERFVEIGNPKDNTIYYKGIRQNVDLEYALTGDSLKENIILKALPSTNSFSFDVSYAGVRLELQEDGSFAARDLDNDKILFKIEKPMATDGNGAMTDRVSISLIRDIMKERFVITINYDWLINAVFPVVIDPDITPIVEISDNSEYNVFDAFIASGSPTDNYGTNPYLFAGYDTTYQTTSSAIWFENLPALAPSAKIVKAELLLYNDSNTTNTVNVYRITSNWGETSINWNSPPAYSVTDPVATNVAFPYQQYGSIDITEEVDGWYWSKLNYGFFLKATIETSAKPPLKFFSSNASTNKPILKISYIIDGIGIESFFPYYGNVNVHNGNLVISEVDVTLPGRGVPIVVTRSYNSRATATTYIGKRWKMNVQMYTIFNTKEDIITLIEGDGTIKYFTKGVGDTYNSPPGVYQKLYKLNGKFILEEKSGIKYHFSGTSRNGYVEKIEDTNGNITAFSYNANWTVNTITDPSNRLIQFNYDPNTGKLSSITGTDIPTVEYSYSGDILLTVQKKDTNGVILDRVTYGSDAYGNITSVTDFEGKKVEYSYLNPEGTDIRVSTIKRTLTMETTIPPLDELITSFNYEFVNGRVITTITHPKQNKTKYEINNNGNVEFLTVGIASDEEKAKPDYQSIESTIQYKWDEINRLREVTSPMGVASTEPEEYTTELEYDDQGNVTRVTNPQGYSITYNYNANSNVTEVVDYLGLPSINTYTEQQNQTMSANSMFSTSAAAFDEFGNVRAQTGPIGMASNLLQNSGFESGTLGTSTAQWSRDAAYAGTVSFDTAYKLNGKRSVKLVSPGNGDTQRAMLKSNPIPVTGKLRYNVNWYVSTINAGTTYGGATVNISWFDSVGNGISTNNNLAGTTGTTVKNVANPDAKDFIRKGARVLAPDNAATAILTLSLSGGANNTQATAWFDNIQFEYIPAINRYSIAHNGDFEVAGDNNQPDGWNVGEPSAGILDTQNKNTGAKSYKIPKGTGTKTIKQEKEISGPDGTPMYFACWTRASGVVNASGKYRMVFEFQKKDSTGEYISTGIFTKDISKAADGVWQFVELSMITTSNFDKVIYSIEVENQQNMDVWFDGVIVRLITSPTAVMSKYNLLPNGNFEYESNLISTDFDDWHVSQDSSVPAGKIITTKRDGSVMPFNGDRMIKITSVPSWATLLSNVREFIDDNTTYTLSAAVKTVNVSGTAISTGAVIKLNVLAADGTYITHITSAPVKGDIDWTIIAISVTGAQIKAVYPSAAQLQVAIGTITATNGTMYFDAIRLTEGSETVRFEYETSNNYVNKVIDQKENVIEFTPDNRGNVKQIKDAKGNIYQIGYTKLDQTMWVKSPNKHVMKFFYKKDGSLGEIVNYNEWISDENILNNTITYNYNELNLPKSILDTKSRATNLEYDKNANLASVKMPNGKSITYDYDSAERPKQKLHVNENMEWNYEYDKNSNLKNVSKTDKNTNITEFMSYEYDKLDRLTSEEAPTVNGVRNRIDYNYNPNNQIDTIRHSILPTTRNKINYKYDMAGFNSDIKFKNDLETEEDTLASFMYDDKSRLKKSYVKSPTTFYNTYREYDELNRLSRLRIENNQTTPVFDYSYAYDANGNRIEDIDNLSTKKVNYSYDENNRLLQENYYTGVTLSRSQSYTYDIMGNRKTKTIQGTTTTYEYENYYELKSQNNTFLFTHDANGNIIKAGAQDIIYNAENQVTSIINSGSVTASYEYDWRGLRTKRTVGSKVEHYYYTGNDLTYITDQLNNLKYYFVRDSGGNLLHMIDYTATPAKTYIYLKDVHGSVVGLANETGIVVSYEYDAWGNVINTPSQTALTGNGEKLAEANPFRYSGYQFDLETGRYYLKHRYYSPSLGRFISMDPVVSHNRYMYCSNNPVNFADPKGLNISRPEEGGTYDKLEYVPIKYPVKGGPTGVFINTNKTGDFVDIGTSLGEVQFEGELQTPVKRESVWASGNITNVKIHTYSQDGKKYAKVYYYGPAQFTIINNIFESLDILSAVGLAGVAGGFFKGLEKFKSAQVVSLIIGLNALNNKAKPDWVLDSETYMLD